MSELKNQLVAIIEEKRLTSLFQPIVSIAAQQIFSFEALIRGPSNSLFHNPISLFSYAEQFNLATELEHACRKASIRQYAQLNLKQKLFLNVSPNVLLHPDFKKGETLRFLKENNISPDSVVIEITEQQPIDDFNIMRSALNHYRNMGFQIALDDLGAGYSSLRVWTELMPDYVKIDRHFIQDINKDPVKLNFVRSIQSMASASNCQVIAEGIETEAEFLAIESIGITFGQGYYFARPCAQPEAEIGRHLFSASITNKPNPLSSHSKVIAEIIKTISATGPDTTVKNVLSLFQKETQLEFLPIVKDGFCSGIVYRDQFLIKLFSNQFGIDLHGKQVISSFLVNPAQSFDKNTAIEQVSQKLTHHLRNDHVFIITDKGNYLGTGTVIDLLEEITKQQVKNAQHANPLTLLPGITPINEKINFFLQEKQPFAIAYFDLDHFKPFNDHYGYDAGDEAIKLVSGLIQEIFDNEADYTGHIGGDDFIVIARHHDWEEKCQTILKTFEQQAPQYYKEKDRINKGIHGQDRQGKACFFPLLSLSIGIVAPEAAFYCSSHIEIADLATEAKHQAKLLPGNSYFINRRIPESVKQQVRPHTFSTQEKHLKMVS
ncbi:MAG: bifunctional diguanylate cyclase/phosphodiesterase [Methyloprofundus sp.]|nr:bifunctional diguanylate cyclase/phosphodiesterase [Methyloprofundus sp.]